MSKQSPGNGFRWLPYLYASGAVLWLILLTQFAAYLVSAVGRDQLRQTLVDQGFKGNLDTLFLVDASLIVFVELAAAILHGVAYYGLRGFRAWGWVVAVIIAAGWSLVLVGIPVLVFLLRRPTRQAYGIS
jgi:hypothetical protein